MDYIKVDGEALDGKIRKNREYCCPSKIIPGIEYIKNTQRSLSGKLHVDISGSKQTLQIIFDMLEQNQFEDIKVIFETNDPSPDGLFIEHFAENLTENPEYGRRFFVDEFTFSPLMTNGDIKWRDINIKLLEI